MTLKSKLPEFNLDQKRVFLRADLNVPLSNGTILDDFKLKSILPTINLILQKHGKVILATHIGRPTGYDAQLSTKNLINWFVNHGYKIEFEPDIDKAYEKSLKNSDTILLLENLRFLDGKQQNDQKFADQLKNLADYYVNDAFGTLHRDDTSLTLLPQLFDQQHKTIGLLVEKELHALQKLKTPEHPFLLILGGAKIKDKLEMVMHLLNKVNTIALCPATVFTFLKAHHINIGKSLVQDDLLQFTLDLEQEAQDKNVKIIYPQDYLVAKKNLQGNLEVIDADKFSSEDMGISIGPKTVDVFIEEIKKAKTIFFNGLPGFIERKETLENINKIFDAISRSNAYCVIGGGDSVAAAIILGYENKITHLSTGGGAVLYFLSNQELPGLKYLPGN
ncbi:MAG: phosphoglycerate kinase [Candidatus Babeliales bacterium]|nr:phosphoglycerate kinase [Candidatus Babeliales bacterium]